MKPFLELNSSKRFILLGQTDKTSEKRLSSDVIQTHRILMHKFENALT